MKRYNCIFPGLYNYNLTKDVGMIPYMLSGDYESVITTYNNDNYTYLDDILNDKDLKLDFLDNTSNEKKDVIRYIKANAKNIDIIQFYHLRYNILPYYVFYYRLYNRKGHIYLKLDANSHYINFLIKRPGFFPSLRRLMVRILFKFIDTVSIETQTNYQNLLNSNIIDDKKLIYIPNGVQKNNLKLNKEKIILYVGYIEKKNKSIDQLLIALSKIDLKDWKVVLIGKIEEDIQEFIDDFFKENPQLKDKIILKGYISDKEVLNKEYAKSSIYCCNSKKESFGISTLEAAYAGNYIISTDVGGSPDIIKLTGYGQIIEHDTKKLEKSLEHTINNWDSIKQNPDKIQKIVYDNFSWESICNRLKKRF